MALKKYRIVGVQDNNALIVEICSNYRYALFQARELLNACDNVTVYQGNNRIKTFIR